MESNTKILDKAYDLFNACKLNILKSQGDIDDYDFCFYLNYQTFLKLKSKIAESPGDDIPETLIGYRCFPVADESHPEIVLHHQLKKV